jgi:Mitochondrial domain of unknown function (DUF1713)
VPWDDRDDDDDDDDGCYDNEEALRLLLSTTTTITAGALPVSSFWTSPFAHGAGITRPIDADDDERIFEQPEASGVGMMDPGPHQEKNGDDKDAAPTSPLLVMSSTLKKRRAKMNKHKLRKRRKLMRLKSK